MFVDVHVLVDVAVDGFWLRSGPFEGPATIKLRLRGEYLNLREGCAEALNIKCSSTDDLIRTSSSIRNFRNIIKSDVAGYPVATYVAQVPLCLQRKQDLE